MILIFLISFLILAGLITFLIQGPPFVASDDKTATDMIKLAASLRPKRIIDLGSGNGKLVILLAQKGYLVDGVEINPILVFRSRWAIKKHGLESKAKIKWGSFWSTNISRHDLVMLYAIKHIMPRLEDKLIKELPNGTHIISNYFVFPNLKPIKSAGKAKLYQIE